MEPEMTHGLRAYRLVHDKGQAFAFEAEDLSGALRHIQTLLPPDARASLIEDGAMLGKVSYSADGFWSISGPPAIQP